MILTFIFGGLTLLFLILTVYFGVQTSKANQNFEDQVDVSRHLIEGLDASMDGDYDRALTSLEDAQDVQQQILDRTGMTTLDHIN